MLRTSTRVLKLLALLQARRRWSGAALAETLEVTHRTLRRDVERLRDLGYSIQSTSGTAGGYRLERDGAVLQPLMLDADEGAAVAVALHVAAGSSVRGMEDAAQRAMSKLERVLPERLRQQTRALRGAVVRLAEAGPTVELETVSALAAACSANRGVAFVYADHHGRGSQRVVEPYCVVHMDRRWYLVGWDTVKRDWRTFRVDRIVPPLASTEYFTRRSAPDGDLTTFITRAVSAAPYRHDVRVRLQAPLARMRAKISPSEGLLERLDDRTCRLSFGTNSLGTTAAWLARLETDFVIEEPGELAQQVRSMAGRLTRAGSARSRTTRATSG
jgi:predicted DNA-binding transcriptional regulator YafY